MQSSQHKRDSGGGASMLHRDSHLSFMPRNIFIQFLQTLTVSKSTSRPERKNQREGAKFDIRGMKDYPESSSGFENTCLEEQS